MPHLDIKLPFRVTPLVCRRNVWCEAGLLWAMKYFSFGQHYCELAFSATRGKNPSRKCHLSCLQAIAEFN